ncbi:related to amidohydrolase family protein [Cephalotrichum gorgonifer]|uniref:Related to amidohydrolase family protein n=1 Tax=Cephalotrichum gorgonifer TaxID=2041049 RepID=A0AAE8MR10_9PEZI|nr:related to amidohydrolase family protein [Cephalotrichum gorgonifer]
MSSRPFGLAVAILIGAVAVVLGYITLQRPLGPAAGPDEIFCYGSVRTHDDDLPSAECFSVRDGLFSSVSAEGPNEKRRRDGHVIPGLWDGHGHLVMYGEFLHSVDLFGSRSFGEVRERLARYLAENPGAGTSDAWVRGVGWDQMALGRMPTADDLEVDDNLRGKFIMFDRVDVHCTWVSQAVLDLLPKDMPDIPGGEIIREPGMGVFCDNAMDVIMGIFPAVTKEKTQEFVRTAMRSLNEVGIVGMHNAGMFPEGLEMLGEMAEQEDLTVRVYSMVECPDRNTFCPDKVRKVDRPDGRFTVRSVKLFADGALGSWGSAMIEPYSDRPDMSGSLLVNSSTLTQLTRSWSAAGFQVNIHAIGDLANRYAIDAMESALRDLCPGEDPAACQARHRFRIEHAQIIHPEDQARMRAMGIIPSIQPTHATSDMKYAEDRLGPERTSAEAYRMQSVLDLGPVLGSDFPVEPADPFQGIFAAVTRRSPHSGFGAGGGPDGWHVEEALSLDEALRGFTTGVAYGGFMEGRAGVIREGAFADWVVLDKPLEDTDIDDLRNMKVRETYELVVVCG